MAGPIVRERVGGPVLGDFLRGRREARGLSQTRLAKLTGIPQTYISRIERGLVGLPQRATRDKLNAALGTVERDWLIAAGEFDAPGTPDITTGGETIDDAILADLLAELWQTAPPEALDVLREMREIEDDTAYRAAVREIAAAFRANLHMGGKMLRIKHPGREA